MSLRIHLLDIINARPLLCCNSYCFQYSSIFYLYLVHGLLALSVSRSLLVANGLSCLSEHVLSKITHFVIDGGRNCLLVACIVIGLSSYISGTAPNLTHALQPVLQCLSQGLETVWIAEKTLLLPKPYQSKFSQLTRN